MEFTFFLISVMHAATVPHVAYLDYVHINKDFSGNHPVPSSVTLPNT